MLPLSAPHSVNTAACLQMGKKSCSKVQSGSGKLLHSHHSLSKCLQALSETGTVCEDKCHPHEFQHVAPMHEEREVIYQLTELVAGQ